MLRLRFLAPLFAVALFGSSFLMGDDKKEPIVVQPTLPKYYNQLRLNPKQKNELSKICSKYAAEIQELKQKISDLEDKQIMDCEKILTDTQKQRLRDLAGRQQGTGR